LAFWVPQLIQQNLQAVLHPPWAIYGLKIPLTIGRSCEWVLCGLLKGMPCWKYHQHQPTRTDDCENSTTRTTLTLEFTLFYSASSHEQLDLFYLSPFAKLQNPPKGKVSELFHSKVGDFPLGTYVATAPIYIGPVHPHQFSVLPSVSTAQPHLYLLSFNKPLPTT